METETQQPRKIPNTNRYLTTSRFFNSLFEKQSYYWGISARMLISFVIALCIIGFISMAYPNISFMWRLLILMGISVLMTPLMSKIRWGENLSDKYANFLIKVFKIKIIESGEQND